MTCLFCAIVSGDIPSNKAYENEQIVAFHDINPRAPVHILIIPKKHIATINEIELNDVQLVGSLILAAKDIARSLNLAQDGYRLVFNTNKNAGQEVFHIHLHLLAGRQLAWPPG